MGAHNVTHSLHVVCLFHFLSVTISSVDGISSWPFDLYAEHKNKIKYFVCRKNARSDFSQRKKKKEKNTTGIKCYVLIFIILNYGMHHIVEFNTASCVARLRCRTVLLIISSESLFYCTVQSDFYSPSVCHSRIYIFLCCFVRSASRLDMGEK